MARGSWTRLTRSALCLPTTIAAVGHAVSHLPDRNLDAILHIQDLDDDGDETLMVCKADWAAAADGQQAPRHPSPARQAISGGSDGLNQTGVLRAFSV